MLLAPVISCYFTSCSLIVLRETMRETHLENRLAALAKYISGIWPTTAWSLRCLASRRRCLDCTFQPLSVFHVSWYVSTQQLMFGPGADHLCLRIRRWRGFAQILAISKWMSTVECVTCWYHRCVFGYDWYARHVTPSHYAWACSWTKDDQKLRCKCVSLKVTRSRCLLIHKR